MLARHDHGVDAALIGACIDLAPFRPRGRSADLYDVAPTAAERAHAAGLARAITSTEQLSRHILATLERIGGA